MGQHQKNPPAFPNVRASRRERGFTLIELLVVIAIISILAVTVFVALNPVRRFRDARNSRRVVDANNYLTAVHACIVDNAGNATPCIGSPVTGTTYEMTSNTTGACTSACAGTTNCLDLDTNLANYLASLPTDPGGVDAGRTEYTIAANAAGIVTINACSAEGTTISAAR